MTGSFIPTPDPRRFSPERVPRKKWEDGALIFKYDGCKHCHKMDKMHCPSLSHASLLAEKIDRSHYDITAVTIGSSNRFFEYSIFASRWDGYAPFARVTPSPVVFVTYLKEEEVPLFDRFLANTTSLCTPRIQFVTYVAPPNTFFYYNYPINILRNLGIRQVRTTHFLLIDMDMWLSRRCSGGVSRVEGSYEALMALPSFVLEDPRAAVVIPAFFHTGWRIANGTLLEQVNS